MKRLWLIRHGHHDWIGKALVGRKRGVGLNEEGRVQAEYIAHVLRAENLAAIYSSPQQRALETAEPLARALDLAISIVKDLDEIDFGEWTGRTFEELHEDLLWREWNTNRRDARAKGGETMVEVQSRALRAVKRLARPDPVAFVSHGDVIRAALITLLGKSLNEIQSIDFSPGEFVLVEMNGDGDVKFTWNRSPSQLHSSNQGQLRRALHACR
jgi:broad specificity phosphatase PhoE